MLRVKEFLTQAASQTNTEFVPKLGAMIETPAAALAARSIAAHADFLSVGTNDLTQYTFAADRENATVDSCFDDAHDVIFRLLKIIHDDVPHVPLSICGKLASRTEAIAKILECGVTMLSVVPPVIPAVKQAVRNCDFGQ
jgi:phosphoenolpyruvate-protein kinase (PTS system EI component)